MAQRILSFYLTSSILAMELDLDYQKNWNNSLGRSIALHVLLLLLAIFFKMQSDPSKTIETQYAVTVSFQEVEFTSNKSSNSTKSQAVKGAQRAKSETPKKIEAPKPTTVPVPKPTPPKTKPTPPTPPVVEPQPNEPVISETTQEESDIQAVEEPIEVEEPEPEYIPQESPEPEPTADIEEVVIAEPDLPTLDDIIGDITDDPIETEEETGIPAEETGSGNETSSGGGDGENDASLKDGDGGTGRGDSGTGKGRDGAGDDDDSGRGTGGYGEGEFDASGDGIFGRKVIFNNYADLQKIYVKSGKIWVKVCINRRGTVAYVEIDEANTTIRDNQILRDALAAAQGYRFEEDYSAAKEQCGFLKFNLDLSSINKFGQ
ncbi:MAG: hypothetical protein AAFR14_03960 [Bacteroidota bacterium]